MPRAVTVPSVRIVRGSSFREWPVPLEVAQAGDARRIADLYRQCGPFVYRRCMRLLKNPDAASDATQEVFLKLVRDEERLTEHKAIVPWMYQVATNYCLNVRRNSMRRGEDRADPDLEVASTTSASAYPDRVLAQAILSQFDAATQAVAVGVIVDGMDHEEVAVALGVSRRTVSRKLERFLETARNYVMRSEFKDGLTDAEAAAATAARSASRAGAGARA
ncbi:MAG: RNA polymerase sigma factor [Anaeromyxobacteraceae bacterium]